MENDEFIIRTENLEYIYQKGMPFESVALKDVNISVKKGSFNAVIGHTGSGKSTLIQHFNALIKPTGGDIYIGKENIKNINLKELRAKVGLVFQYPEHQLFEETVYKDICYGPVNLGLSQSEINERVNKAASLAGVEDILSKSPFELSGGQKRRAAIAGVLAMRPEVLILDEPTAGLDPAGRDDILNGIRRMKDCIPELTVILVSHSMEDVAKFADNIIVMNNGTNVMSGTPGEVFSHAEELIRIGLDIPEITRIVHILRKKGLNIPDGIYTVDDAVRAICGLKEELLCSKI